MQYPLEYPPCSKPEKKELIFKPGYWYKCVKNHAFQFTKGKFYLCVCLRTQEKKYLANNGSHLVSAENISYSHFEEV
jgi:hypothetical protein